MTETEFWAVMARLAIEQEQRHAQLEAQLQESRTQLEAKLSESQAQLQAQLAKTDAQLAKTDAQLNKLSKLFGEVNNNRGEVAEEFFFRSLERHPWIGGMKFDTVHRNLNGSKGKVQDEFDLVLVNGDSLAIIEVKNKAHLNLVEKIIEEKVPNLRFLFPQFKNYKIFAGIASLVSYASLIEKTREQGLFLLTQHGKHLELVNKTLHAF
jgi:hypothetical protein